MTVCVNGGGEGATHASLALAAAPRPQRRPGSHVAGPDRAARGGGRRADRRRLPPLSGPALRPARAPARSSTARGRARLPGGGGPLVAAGTRGRRPGGELASSWPLAEVRGNRSSSGGSGARTGGGGGGSRRPPAAPTAGRPKAGELGGEAGGRPVRRAGRRPEPRPRAGRMEGGWGAPGTHLHLHRPLTARPPAGDGPGARPCRRGASRPGEGEDRTGPQSAVGRGPSRRLRAVISYQVFPPRLARRAGRRRHLALRAGAGTGGAGSTRGLWLGNVG